MENSIHDRRKALGFSQQELAKRCGVSRQTINAIENNKYDPTLARASDNRRCPFLSTMTNSPEKSGLLFICAVPGSGSR